MPALFINWIESATWSYSLSSIAVDPTNSKPTSINSSTSATLASLSLIYNFACIDFKFQSWYSSSSKYLSARYKVLSPSFA